MSDKFDLTLDLDGKKYPLGKEDRASIADVVDFGEKGGIVIVFKYSKEDSLADHDFIRVIQIKDNSAKVLIDGECFGGD